jgi:hypothetical protein
MQKNYLYKNLTAQNHHDLIIEYDSFFSQCLECSNGCFQEWLVDNIFISLRKNHISFYK